MKRVYRLYVKEGLSVRRKKPGLWPSNTGARARHRRAWPPENVRSDNGPEFTSRRMLGWAADWKVGLVHIQPGRPMQNGYVESFHGRLRDECLKTSWFRTLNDVRCTLNTWREEYNGERPHSSLDYRTPREFKFAFEVSGPMGPLTSTTTTSYITEKTPARNGLRKRGQVMATCTDHKTIMATCSPA